MRAGGRRQSRRRVVDRRERIRAGLVVGLVVALALWVLAVLAWSMLELVAGGSMAGIGSEIFAGIGLAGGRITVRGERTIWDDVERMPGYAQLPAALVVGVVLLVRLVVVAICRGVAWLWRRGRWGRAVLAVLVLALALAVWGLFTRGAILGCIFGGDGRPVGRAGVVACSGDSPQVWKTDMRTGGRCAGKGFPMGGAARGESPVDLFEGQPVPPALRADPVSPHSPGVGFRPEEPETRIMPRVRNTADVVEETPWTVEQCQGTRPLVTDPRTAVYDIM